MASQKKKAKAASSRKKPVRTTAFQIGNKDGSTHVVGIGNLRVMLQDDEGSWFAQGLEVDYFAQGSTIEDAQRRFQEGLRETIDFHLKMYGKIDGVLRVAPQEVWDEFHGDQPGLRKLYSQVSIHLDGDLLTAFPYESIAYYGKEQAAA